jgi:hypothetical protein
MIRMNRATLKKLVKESLRAQGFRLREGRVVLPSQCSKDKLRELHAFAVQHRIERCKDGLVRHEPRLLSHIAKGTEIIPERIAPRLIEVLPDSDEELLFRYATLHWSIPVSSGYGRRLRFLVIDEQNKKLIGLFGLRDPIFSLAARDEWVGWGKQDRNERLQHVMEAYALGAVPPYSSLLCGKLVAMLVASDEVRAAFHRKYRRRRSLIQRRNLDARLALLTTTSALGRSSIYNRLRFHGRLLYLSAGFTQGSGEIHFSNGLYDALSDYANRYCEPTAKCKQWGTGFRNRRELVRKCLAKIGLPADWIYHGIRREVFVVPLAKNARKFLSGEHSKLLWYEQSVNDLFSWFRERWLLPRARRDLRYLEFAPSSYRLWNDKG